jgi:F0F1-type ATP synthase assembly protein I
MNGKGNGAVDRAAAEGRAQGLDTGWQVVSYLIGGMIAYGGIGWLIGRAVHVALIFPLGMLLGMAISIAYIIHHYGHAPGVNAPGVNGPGISRPSTSGGPNTSPRANRGVEQ